MFPNPFKIFRFASNALEYLLHHAGAMGRGFVEVSLVKRGG